MLSDEAFLRNVPRVIDLESRLKWEVLVNASDAIAFAYSQLLSVLTVVSKLADYKDAEPYRRTVSVYCWTIIDQSHAIFQILRGFDRIQEGEIDTLLSTYGQVISNMRNGMDHIHQQINNISKKKDAGYGIYGSIAFTTPIKSDGAYAFVNFALGGMQFNEQIGCSIDIHAVPLLDQIGNISFASFDVNVNFSELVSSLHSAINQLDLSIKTHVVPLIAEHVKNNSLNLEDVLNETTKGTVYMQFQFQIEEH